MKRFLKWLFMILFAVLFIGLFAGIVFVYNLDLNTYKPRIEQLVLEQTGRKLSLTGNIGFKISLRPTLNIKQVSFANANWAGNTPMIEAEEADISIAIMPLFKKVLRVENIQLIQPKIHLSLNEEGEGNWIFDKKIPEAISSTSGSQKSFLSDMKLMIKQISIEDAIITYDTPKTKINLQIKYLSLKPDGRQILVDYEFLYNGQKIKGTMKGDTLEHLAKGKTYHAEIDTNALNCQIKADVSVTDILSNWNIMGWIDVISSEGNFNLPELHLKSDINASSQKISFKTKQLNFGESILQIDADVSLKKKTNIQAKINGALLDISSLTFPKEEVSSVKSAQDSQINFLPQGDLDLDFLNHFDADINLDIGRIIFTPEADLNKLKGKVEIKNGIFNLKKVSFIMAEGSFKGNLFLNSKGNDIKLDLDGEKISLSALMKFLKADTNDFVFKKDGILRIHGALRTKGKSYYHLFKNLQGQILLAIGPSQIKSKFLKYIQGNFLTQLTSSLNISQNERDVNLKCAVIRADFDQGKAQFPKGIAFDSKELRLVADGNIDLANGKIDMQIQPLNGDLTNTNAGQILSSLIKITGTLMEPSIAVNSTSVIKNTIGIVAGGAVFVGTKLLLDSDADPCYTALQGTSYNDMFTQTTGAKAEMQRMYRRASDDVEGVISNAISSPFKTDENGKTTLRFIDWF